ncbi:WXG100-like domain-containing protein [Saccharopolyspora sp. 5N708]|uniref:WXG100-like domain-containing protein n=1 Tax=Saccharopolyspora sp. 5N708 TaxID=3457424 RepID=UPI003FD3A9CD
MSIDIPPALNWVFYLVGQPWPRGDEDRAWRAAELYQEAKRGLATIAEDGDSLLSAVRRGQQGEAAAATVEHLRQLRESFQPLIQAADQLGQQTDKLGTDLEYTKMSLIVQLGWLAAEIALAIKAAVETFGVSLLSIPGMIALVRVAWLQLVKQLMTMMANRAAAMAAVRASLGPILAETAKIAVKIGAIMGGIDAGVQLLQLAKGSRDEFDGLQLLKMTGFGAVAGGIAGGLGSVFTRATSGGATGAAATRLLGGAANAQVNPAVKAAVRQAMRGDGSALLRNTAGSTLNQLWRNPFFRAPFGALGGLSGTMVINAIEGRNVFEDAGLGALGGAVGGAAGRYTVNRPAVQIDVDVPTVSSSTVESTGRGGESGTGARPATVAEVGDLTTVRTDQPTTDRPATESAPSGARELVGTSTGRDSADRPAESRSAAGDAVSSTRPATMAETVAHQHDSGAAVDRTPAVEGRTSDTASDTRAPAAAAGIADTTRQSTATAPVTGGEPAPGNPARSATAPSGAAASSPVQQGAEPAPRPDRPQVSAPADRGTEAPHSRPATETAVQSGGQPQSGAPPRTESVATSSRPPVAVDVGLRTPPDHAPTGARPTELRAAAPGDQTAAVPVAAPLTSSDAPSAGTTPPARSGGTRSSAQAPPRAADRDEREEPPRADDPPPEEGPRPPVYFEEGDGFGVGSVVSADGRPLHGANVSSQQARAAAVELIAGGVPAPLGGVVREAAQRLVTELGPAAAVESLFAGTRTIPVEGGQVELSLKPAATESAPGHGAVLEVSKMVLPMAFEWRVADRQRELSAQVSPPTDPVTTAVTDAHGSKLSRMRMTVEFPITDTSLRVGDQVSEFHVQTDREVVFRSSDGTQVRDQRRAGEVRVQFPTSVLRDPEAPAGPVLPVVDQRGLSEALWAVESMSGVGPELLRRVMSEVEDSPSGKAELHEWLTRAFSDVRMVGDAWGLLETGRHTMPGSGTSVRIDRPEITSVQQLGTGPVRVNRLTTFGRVELTSNSYQRSAASGISAGGGVEAPLQLTSKASTTVGTSRTELSDVHLQAQRFRAVQLNEDSAAVKLDLRLPVTVRHKSGPPQQFTADVVAYLRVPVSEVDNFRQALTSGAAPAPPGPPARPPGALSGDGDGLAAVHSHRGMADVAVQANLLLGAQARRLGADLKPGELEHAQHMIVAELATPVLASRLEVIRQRGRDVRFLLGGEWHEIHVSAALDAPRSGRSIADATVSLEAESRALNYSKLVQDNNRKIGVTPLKLAAPHVSATLDASASWHTFDRGGAGSGGANAVRLEYRGPARIWERTGNLTIELRRASESSGHDVASRLRADQAVLIRSVVPDGIEPVAPTTAREPVRGATEADRERLFGSGARRVELPEATAAVTSSRGRELVQAAVDDLVTGGRLELGAEVLREHLLRSASAAPLALFGDPRIPDRLRTAEVERPQVELRTSLFNPRQVATTDRISSTTSTITYAFEEARTGSGSTASATAKAGSHVSAGGGYATSRTDYRADNHIVKVVHEVNNVEPHHLYRLDVEYLVSDHPRAERILVPDGLEVWVPDSIARELRLPDRDGLPTEPVAGGEVPAGHLPSSLSELPIRYVVSGMQELALKVRSSFAAALRLKSPDDRDWVDRTLRLALSNDKVLLRLAQTDSGYVHNIPLRDSNDIYQLRVQVITHPEQASYEGRLPGDAGAATARRANRRIVTGGTSDTAKTLTSSVGNPSGQMTGSVEHAYTTTRSTPWEDVESKRVTDKLSGPDTGAHQYLVPFEVRFEIYQREQRSEHLRHYVGDLFATDRLRKIDLPTEVERASGVLRYAVPEHELLGTPPPPHAPVTTARATASNREGAVELPPGSVVKQPRGDLPPIFQELLAQIGVPDGVAGRATAGENQLIHLYGNDVLAGFFEDARRGELGTEIVDNGPVFTDRYRVRINDVRLLDPVFVDETRISHKRTEDALGVVSRGQGTATGHTARATASPPFVSVTGSEGFTRTDATRQGEWSKDTRSSTAKDTAYYRYRMTAVYDLVADRTRTNFLLDALGAQFTRDPKHLEAEVAAGVEVLVPKEAARERGLPLPEDQPQSSTAVGGAAPDLAAMDAILNPHTGPRLLDEIVQELARIDPEAAQLLRRIEPTPFEATPGGSSLHTDPNMRDLAQRVPDDGAHHTVDVHALPDGRVRVGDRDLNAREFADALRGDPNWDGQPIRLLSCDAGTSGLARELSRELGVPVTAPRGLVWTDGSGRVFASSRAPDGRPGWPPNGSWDTHHPDGTTTPASANGFHPPRDGEDPGTPPQDAQARSAVERIESYRPDPNRGEREDGHWHLPGEGQGAPRYAEYQPSEFVRFRVDADHTVGATPMMVRNWLGEAGFHYSMADGVQHAVIEHLYGRDGREPEVYGVDEADRFAATVQAMSSRNHFEGQQQVVAAVNDLASWITRQYPPEQYSYVGLGRSPGPVVAALRSHGHDAAAVPLSKFRPAPVDLNSILRPAFEGPGREPKALTDDQQQLLDVHFQEFLGHLPEDRNILLIDYTQSALSLVAAQHYLQQHVSAHREPDMQVHALAVHQDINTDTLRKTYNQAAHPTTFLERIVEQLWDTERGAQRDTWRQRFTSLSLGADGPLGENGPILGQAFKTEAFDDLAEYGSYELLAQEPDTSNQTRPRRHHEPNTTNPPTAFQALTEAIQQRPNDR